MTLKRKLKINKGIEEIAEIINSLLTKQQRIDLTIVLNNKKFSFKERLILLYRKMKPKYSRLETRFLAASIIKANQDVFDKNTNENKDINSIEDFAQKFRPLFNQKYQNLSRFLNWLWSNREQIVGVIKGLINAKPKIP